jgi:Ni,Fe-hydrogenase I cytochrome b subunit
MALFLMRLYLFFAGNRWVGWRQFIPIEQNSGKKCVEVTKFYAFLRPTAVSKIGHNPMAALSYWHLRLLLWRSSPDW